MAAGREAARKEHGLELDRFIPYRLSVASNTVSELIARSYRNRFGLNVPEWRLIAILAEADRLTPAELVQRTRTDKIGVSRAAAALRERELIAAERNPADGRSHFLSLTAEGRRLYEEIAPAALAVEAQLLAEFSVEEAAMLESLLRRIEAKARG